MSRARQPGMCRHDGFHSPTGLYDSAGALVFVLHCDGCGSVVREFDRMAYRPDPQGIAGRPPPAADDAGTIRATS